MAIATKSISDAVKYWIDGATARAARYAANAPAAASKWLANTVGAAANYKASVQVADIDRRFSGGVNKAGATSFASGINTTGKDRYAPGVTAKQANYVKGETPMLNVIASVDRGTRGIRGTASNYDIVKRIGDALHAARIAGKVS